MPIYPYYARHISLPQCRHVISSPKLSFFLMPSYFQIYANTLSCQVYIFNSNCCHTLFPLGNCVLIDLLWAYICFPLWAPSAWNKFGAAQKIPTKALVLPYDVIQCKDLGDDKLGQCWPFLALLVTITLLCGQTMTLGSHTLLQKLQLNAIKSSFGVKIFNAKCYRNSADSL